MTSRPIPTIDLSAFAANGSQSARLKASKDLFEACHQFGFANITGHGVPEAQLEDAFAWTRKLFALPLSDKMKAPHPPTPTPHRGYSGVGIEKVYSKEELDANELKGVGAGELRKIEDVKESYEIGSAVNPVHPNIWLPGSVLPGFRVFMADFYWTLEKAAQRILSAIALALNLTPEETQHLNNLHTGHNNQLRLLHYPSIDIEDDIGKAGGQAAWDKMFKSRMPAHQDWSAFTFLFQRDGVSGLEMQDPQRPGEFVAATPVEGACMLNVGDMLERFSNGIFRSALHRVTLPSPPTSSSALIASGTDADSITRIPERYSIPYFVAPDNDALVSCLNSCVSEERPEKYEPVKFADYGDYLSKYMYSKNEKEA